MGLVSSSCMFSCHSVFPLPAHHFCPVVLINIVKKRKKIECVFMPLLWFYWPTFWYTVTHLFISLLISLLKAVELISCIHIIIENWYPNLVKRNNHMNIQNNFIVSRNNSSLDVSALSFKYYDIDRLNGYK